MIHQLLLEDNESSNKTNLKHESNLNFDESRKDKPPKKILEGLNENLISNALTAFGHYEFKSQAVGYQRANFLGIIITSPPSENMII